MTQNKDLDKLEYNPEGFKQDYEIIIWLLTQKWVNKTRARLIGYKKFIEKTLLP